MRPSSVPCLPILAAALLLFLPHPLTAANVTINAASNLVTVAQTAYGIHTSVYDNQNGNASLPGRLLESGVNTLRYSGGGYADVYHWAVGKVTPWFNNGSYGYVGPNTDFGHFAQLLDSASSTAVITINFGSSQKWNAGHTALIASNGGQAQEAAAWVAYANGNAALYGTPGDIAIGSDADGNDWKTVGFWAKLRSSTLAQYQSWAGTNYSADYNFLAINHPFPQDIKYWEIGNETFGNAYYEQTNTVVSGATGYSENLFAPFTVDRRGHPNLSPAFYGQKVNEFAAAMKAVDPTIKIGTVLSTPPDDYNWDYYQRYNANSPYNEINSPTSPGVKHWNPEVLSQCASNTDFVIAHWYPYIGNSSDGSLLFSFVPAKLPQMIFGSTAGQDSGANAGLRDWINAYRPTDGSNVQIFITEFGYFGSLANSVLGPGNALFAADSYATWMDLGVANVDYLEMNKTAFLGDSSGLTRGAVFYALKTLHYWAAPGDRLIKSTSDQALLRAHAALQQNGKLALLFINTDLASNQTVNVTVTNTTLATSGTRYQFGVTNFPANNQTPSSGPSSNSVSGLGNSFSVSVPALSIVVLTIPTVATPPNTPPALAAISNRTVNVGQTVAFTASVTDTDQPPQTLTFTLLSGPFNATLNASSGAFSWRPLVAQAQTANPVSIKVADSGAPSLSATQNFTVTVNALIPSTLSQATWDNSAFRMQVNGISGPDYALQGSSNLSDWTTLLITNSPPVPFQFTTNASAPMQFYRVKAGPPLP